MAEGMGVSRNTIREAIRSLNLMGFIVSVQGDGNYVSCNFNDNFKESIHWMLLMDEIDYQEISELREGIESYGASLAVGRISDVKIRKIVEIGNKMEKTKDENTLSKLDKELHFTIIEGSKNKLIINILDGLSSALDTFIPTMRKKIQEINLNSEELHLSHLQMIEGLVKRDNDIVREAYQLHFRLIDQSLKI